MVHNAVALSLDTLVAAEHIYGSYRSDVCNVLGASNNREVQKVVTEQKLVGSWAVGLLEAIGCIHRWTDGYAQVGGNPMHDLTRF